MKRFLVVIILINGWVNGFSQNWSMANAINPSSTNNGINPSVSVLCMRSLKKDTYIIGSFFNNIEYNGYTAREDGTSIYVLKLDDNGTVLSLRSFPVAKGEESTITSGYIDDMENLYCAVTVKPNTQTYFGYSNISDEEESLLLKLNLNMDLQWAKKIMSGKREVKISNISINGDEIYITGRAGIVDKNLQFEPINTHTSPSWIGARSNLYNTLGFPKEYNYDIDTLIKYHNLNPTMGIEKDIAANKIRAYWLNRDTLNKYGHFIDNQSLVKQWKNYLDLIYSDFELYKNKYNFGTTVTVGEKQYTSEIHYVHIVACVSAIDGTIAWSNGFTNIIQPTYVKPGFFIPADLASTTTILRDVIYFDSSLYLVGSHDGWIIDEKKYITQCGSSGLNSRQNDLLLMRLSAKNGKVEWVQTGGGYGFDEYMKIRRNDNYLMILGQVSPGTTTRDARTGYENKNGISLDSVANMQTDTIQTQSKQRKQSARFAKGDGIGIFYAKYNTEGRLLNKTYIPMSKYIEAHDKIRLHPLSADWSNGLLGTTIRIQNGYNTDLKIPFNLDTITVPAYSGVIAACIFEENGNLVKATTISDPLAQMSSVLFMLKSDSTFFVSGISYSEELKFKLTDKEKIIRNTHYQNNTSHLYTDANVAYIAKANLQFTPVFTHVQHVQCYGKENGELKVGTFFKNEEKCTYKWEKIGNPDYKFSHVPIGMKTPENIDSSVVYNLPAGVYRVKVRNGNIERELTQEIKEPSAIELSGIVSDSKWCENTGEIVLNVTGGTGNYAYFWEQGDANAIIQTNQVNSDKLTQLGEGKYRVEIIDDNNCRIYQEFEVNAVTNKMKINNSNLSWDFSNKKLTLTTTEADIISNCMWKNESQSDVFQETSTVPQIFEASILNAGLYTIIITYTDGCTQTLSENLINPSEFYVKANVDSHISCYNDNNGIISLIPINSNGTEYIDKWELNGEVLNPMPSMTDGKYSNLKGGIHTITYKHDGGYYTLTVKIDEPDKLEVVMHKRNVTCAENSDGQIAVEVKGGTEPYNFLWQDIDKSNQTRNGLNATNPIEDTKYAAEDNYIVTVTDNKGCKAKGEAVIRKPKPITAQITSTHPSCAGYNNGRLEINKISGGNGYLHHIWSNTLMAPEIHGLRDGQYYVTIYDSLGCKQIIGGNNLQLARPYETIITEDIVSPTCTEISDGSITIESFKIGQPKFKYKWNGVLPTNIIDTLPILRDIPSGIYELTVTDMTDKCETKKLYDLRAQNTPPKVDIVLSNRTICDGESLQIYVDKDGSSLYDYFVNDKIQAQSIQAKYSESLNIYKDTLDVTISEPGDYTLSIIDYSETNEAGKRCQGKATANLTVKPTPSARIDADSALAWCKGTAIKLNLSVASQPNTSMLWTRGNDTLATGLTLNIDALGVGTYTLRTERENCRSIDSVKVVEIEKEDMNLAVIPSDPSQGLQSSDTLWCYGLGHIATLSASRKDARSYLWFRNGDTLTLGNGNSIGSPELMTNIPGKYHIVAGFGGCYVTTDTIKIGPRPRIELKLAKDTTIIAGAPFIIDLGENAAIQTYNWTDKDGQNTLSNTHFIEIDTRYAQDGEVRDYKVAVVDTNACPATAQIRVKIRRAAAQTTGLTDASVDPLTIYPNPAHNGFFVEAPATDRIIHVYGTSGQIVLEQPISGKTWVDTSRLPAGLYMVRTETAAAKVVVQ